MFVIQEEEAANVVTAVFDGSTVTRARALYQYDTGQILKFAGIELPMAYEVHFAKGMSGQATTRIGGEDGVAIPSALLEKTGPVYAWVYLHAGTNDGETRYGVEIPVLRRAEPETLEPTEEELDAIAEAIIALNAAVEKTEADVIAAGTSASAAVGSASDAEAWAVGERYGDPVESTDPTYHNNSKYYAGEAASAAQIASQDAQTASDAVITAGSAKTAAETAQGKAETAQEKAEAAQTAAENAAAKTALDVIAAANSADEASGYANTASGYASTASGYATAAQGHANDASGYASSASGYATNAYNSETAAAGSAGEASGYASDASGYATAAGNAKTDAEAAQIAAETAQGLAEAAQTGAEAAQTAAESARDAAIAAIEDKAPVILDSASGAIVSITDGANSMNARSLVAFMEPIQDLHGYSNPWPAGGGKNLFDPTANPGKWIGFDGTLSNVTGAKTSQKIETGGAVETYVLSAEGTATGILCIAGYAADDSLVDRKAQNGVNNLTFTTTAEMAYIRGAVYSDLTMQLEKSASKTDFAPYSNICPISGRTGVTAYRTGKNLLNNTDLFTWGNWSATVAPDGDMKSVDGNRIFTFPKLEAGKTYVISFGFVGSTFPTYLYFGYHKDGTATRLAYISTDSLLRTEFSFTAVDGYNYCLRMGNTDTQTRFDNQIAKWSNCQLEIGSTASAYEPYTGTSYPVSWQTKAGTVYGGTVDIVSGVLTVDRALHDLGDKTWQAVNNNEDSRTQGLFAAALPGDAYSVPTYSSADIPDILSDTFHARPNWYFLSPGRGPGEAVFSQYNKQVYVNWSALSGKTNEEAKAALTGVIVCYRLATPVTCRLDPQTVQLLRGANTVWADGASSIDLIYPCDTKLFIMRMIG